MKAFSIDRLYLDIPQGKKYWHSFESETSGFPVSFNDAEKQELIDFVTRDQRTRCLSWEEITVEMGHACSVKAIQRVVQSMKYHKRVPWRKLNVRPDNRPRRAQWVRKHPSWAYEEWKRALWTDESSFSTVGLAIDPGSSDHPKKGIILIAWMKSST